MAENIVNIGERYHKDYGQEIKAIEVKLAYYADLIDKVTRDLLDPAHEEDAEALMTELEDYQHNMVVLSGRLRELRETLKSVDAKRGQPRIIREGP